MRLRGSGRPRCGYSHAAIIILLHFLGSFAQGQGPGTIELSVLEERPVGTPVGSVGIVKQYEYTFQDATDLFDLSLSGDVTTAQVIDREKLSDPVIRLLVIGAPVNIIGNIIRINLEIRVLDVNDNSPSFGLDGKMERISFQEDAQPDQGKKSIAVATDPDEGHDGDIEDYEIVSGNEDGMFGLEKSGLPLILFVVKKGAENFDREKVDSYRLNISARDGGRPPRYGYLAVDVSITDVNDKAPAFDISEYTTRVNESAPAKSWIFKAEATDDDIGRNGEVVYHLEDETRQFKIEENTGVIRTLVSPLVCSQDCKHDPKSKCCFITVVASDKGPNSLTGRAYLYVEVLDENDHDPEITFVKDDLEVTTVSIDENAPIRTPVASISITDEDSGSNGETSVRIIRGNGDGYFMLLSVSIYKLNEIRVNKTLDRETLHRFNLTIEASDKGNPPRTTISSLIILINDANDHYPEFQSPRYEVSMSELAKADSFVASVKATDADEGVNSELTYSISTGNALGWFHIDPQTGLVTTKGQLDHETTDQVTLNVSAHDGGAEIKYSYTTLVVNIIDENDVAPTFNQSLYVQDLKENLDPDTEIIQLVARDFDQGANGTVEYSIHPDTQHMHSGAFGIGTLSGKLVAKQRFDREDKSEYIVKILAKDRGTPSLSSTASVRLIIKDVNDNSPLFAPEVNYVNVFDSDPLGVPVIRVTATDRDIGDFGKVSYSLKNYYNIFDIDVTSGVISTLRSLTRPEYRLTVTAVDGGRRASENDATVNIIVTSTTSSVPTFSQPSYAFTITEDSSDKEPRIGKVVGQVKATTTSASPIRYAITGGDTQSVFQIDGNGVITTRLVVDREEKEEYSLTVIAFAGEKISSRKVTILVEDVNDNGPVFITETTEANVLENWPVGHNVFLAQAIDRDKGTNQKLIYTLSSEDDKDGIFTIDSSSGVISLAKQPKLMRMNPVTLTVTAADSIAPPRSESMKVTIHLIDENDHTPLFVQSHYELFLSEYQPVNEMVMLMSAIDNDEGRNSDLTYSLVRGNEDHKFGIFPDGSLYVAYPLDRETRDMYSLTVHVQDSGFTPRSSSVNVSVYVQDENDNAPRFDENGYEFSIKENSNKNTFIGSVKATDSDVGRNAEVMYTLAVPNSNFTIDPITGAIYTKRSFDREYIFETSKVSYYRFSVVATDNGFHKLHRQVPVKVNIQDVNDNTPLFSSDKYTTFVKENIVVDDIIFTVTAVDADEGSNAAVSYSISGGNEEKKFKINAANGQIILQGTLDRETTDQYLLTVKASDTGGNDLQEAETEIEIFVLDYNDNTPDFAPSQPSIGVSELTQPGEALIVFSGTDKDIGNNGKLMFRIVSGNDDDIFRLDNHTGKLYLARELDYDKGKRTHDLNITLSDSGYPFLSTARMFKVRVIDANDNAPRFLDGISKIHVDEDADADSDLLQLQAEDLDSGNFGRIVFNVYKQTPAGDTFEIDNTGKLSLKRTLDRETVGQYVVVIHAVDQDPDAARRQTAERTLTIIVRDVNDNPPVFQSPSVFLVPYPSPQDSTIATLSATDADSESNMKYTFSSPQQAPFKLNPTRGTLSLAQNLPPTPLTYSFTILASDHEDPNKAQTTSHVIQLLLVTSASNGPEFTSFPTGTVSENVNIGKSVTMVTAGPSSPGLRVSYYLTRTASLEYDYGGLFVVDPDSGIISTGQELDSEQLPSEFTLDISAIETEGTEQRVTTAQVLVRLRDINDNPPVFGSSIFDATVPENGPPGGSVARIVVEDPDVTGKVSLALTGDGADDFKIDPNGVIMSNEPLNFEAARRHELRVDAWDGASKSTCYVLIYVKDTNDHVPEFTKPFYSFDLYEDAPVGHTIGKVTAIDKDADDNGKVVYELVSDWGKEFFKLDPLLGHFTLVNHVDFEERHVYILTVLAKDKGASPLTSKVTVYVNVKDVNDNQPEFDPMTYSMEIWENAGVGTLVVNVSATDVDSGLNGDIRFNIFGDDADFFGIGPINGSIYTTAALDREIRPVHNIVVVATDQAAFTDDRQSTTSTVEVKLKDVNDSPPTFTSPDIVEIREDAEVDSTVFTVTAEDLDESVNGQVTFTLLSGMDLFDLESQSGALKLKKQLDRESEDSHTIAIEAKDGGSDPHKTQQTLTIRVQDANDNAPVFKRPVRRETVSEDVTVGKSLLRVYAEDKDEGLNGAVRYFIVGGSGQHDFHLDMSSGVLRVQKTLDYERTKEYTLTIQAEDSSVENPLQSNSTIIISVTDVNDFIPVFDNSPYHTFVQEGLNADLELPIFNITARDEDSGRLGFVQYNLRNSVDYPGVFKIEPLSGQVIVLKSLDRESTPQYVLTIIAIDSGLNSQTGTTTLTVFVKDVNDHSPVFEGTGPYVAHVTENMPVGTPMMTVTALDIDEGINSKITYSLVDSKHGRFTIDPHTGELATASKLDRELDDHYLLTVVATDQGIPPRSASMEVQIKVNDDNDHPPDFRTKGYSVVIYDSSNTADFVLGVTAIDRDIGNNGKVVYALDGDDASSFHISSETGVITHATSLKENGRTFNFVVRASDLGTKPLNSTAPVTVQMSSISSDEVRPLFQDIPSSLKVKENRGIGSLLTTVRAASSRSSRVTYHIAGGNVNNAFSINSGNGSILVAGQIDYEVTSRFQLWVEARDQGMPPLSAFHEVTINVEDMNDNDPVFEESVFHAEITENCRVGTTVTQVIATDLDSGDNQQLVYSLKGGNTNNTFHINPGTGLITTINRVVDRERIPLFTLLVEASDSGEIKRSASTTVRVVIEDANDNQPTFTGSRSVAVPEDLPIGSLIMQLTTNDKDIGKNAKAKYTFVKTNGNELPFEIDEESGNISTTGKLDAESIERYRPEVSVTDGSFIQQTSLTIRLLDVNDNAPQFRDKILSFNFLELQHPGAFVGTLAALDKDRTSPNKKFFFSLKRPSSLFELNAETGQIIALEMFHFFGTGMESMNEHVLEAVVTDLGVPSLSSESTVIIKITDFNDHAPVFDQASYFSAVPVNLATYETILHVHAEDKNDYGVNAEIVYSLAAGSGVQFFSINSTTGAISPKVSLSGRVNQKLSLTVQAQDKGKPPQSSIATVEMVITPINSQAPKFTTRSFTKTIKEDVDDGYLIDTISASDSDSGLNGGIKYSITGGNELDLFQIGEDNGKLRVKGRLDYETETMHVVTITARDRGLFYKQVSKDYIVRLEDVNDNTPFFEYSYYDAYVAENTNPSTSFFRLSASDADTEQENTQIRYSITGGSDAINSLFRIDQVTGELSSRARFDYEKKTLYTLLIMAHNPDSDNKPVKKSVTTVYVHVTGVNENKPKFIENQYSFGISESAATGFSVGSVSAVDLDKGPDGVVYYYLEGQSNLKGFSVDALTGILRVAERADYESSPHIILTVMAKNWGSITGDDDTDTATVNITVSDANDPPEFKQSNYKASIPENSDGSIFVIQVEAEDKDVQPKNRRFSYRILNGDIRKFRINPTTGNIDTAGLGVLDRETSPVFTLIVVAEDEGTPPMTGTTTVEVQLTDVNDKGPQFEPLDLTVYVSENETAGVLVTTLEDSTIDLDLPPNQGPFTYRIVDGPASRYFQISEQTGRVETKQRLTRDMGPEFRVPVIVWDNGTPIMSSTLTFTVIVKDMGSSPPKPRPLNLEVNVLERGQISGKIGDVRPLDSDAKRDYLCSIIGDSSNFVIRSACELEVVGDLSPRVYKLLIKATNSKFPSVSYNITVKVDTVSSETLDNSVAVVIRGINSSRFLESAKYESFETAVNEIFGPSFNCRLFGLKEEGGNLYAMVSVHSSVGDILPREDLIRGLTSSASVIEARCGVKINTVAASACNANTCANGGTCVSTAISLASSTLTSSSSYYILTTSNMVLTPVCSCTPAFTGPLCNTSQVRCGGDYCNHEGKCVDGRCQCPDNWQGDFCNDDVDECLAELSSPCRNNGVCRNRPGSFECECVDGFHGVLCELQDYCASQPCSEHGTCVDQSGSYECQCEYGYHGSRCEYSSMSFKEGSYLVFSPVDNYGIFNASMYFATVDSHSLLMFSPVFSGQGSLGFIAMEIVGGRMKVSFRLSGEDLVELVTGTRVDTGHWYRVEFNKVTQASNSISNLIVQRCDEASCSPCNKGPDCYNEAVSPSSLQVQGRYLSLGGIRKFQDLVDLQGEVTTHDFVGCMHSVAINGRSYVVNRMNPGDNVPTDSWRVGDKCPRGQARSPCETRTCYNGGKCVDAWSGSSCYCPADNVGLDCREAKQPFTLGSNGVIKYTLKQSYVRNSKLSASKTSRRKRALPNSSIMIRFRTTKKSGSLYQSETVSLSSLLWFSGNSLHFLLKSNDAINDPLELPNLNMTDGEWHNVTVRSDGTRYTLDYDGKISRSRDFGIEYDFDSLDILDMAISQQMVLPDNTVLPGFDGCLSRFLVNGNPLPMNGSSEKYDIQLTGEVGSKCLALCDGNACGGSDNCRVDGEEFECLLMAKASEGLETGIIVIIVFFIILLLAIVVVFVLFHTRRDLFNRCVKTKKQSRGPSMNGSNGKTMANSDSIVSPGVGSRYAHNPSEEEIIRGHIMEELAGQKSSSLSTRPDLIGHSYSPQMLTDGVMIMDPDDMQVIMDEEGAPEHYDFENASSIAPSDIAPSEVIRHYRDFRNGTHPHHHHHHHQNKNPHSSHLFNKFRDSPTGGMSSANNLRGSPHNLVPAHAIQQPRQSPISLSGSAMSVPAHSTSPSVLVNLNGGRPSSALASLNHQPPRARMSPLTQLHVRSPRAHPHNAGYNYNSSTAYSSNNPRDSRSNSIGSHHSHSSSSSATAVPNGYPANQSNQKYSGNKPGGRTRPPKGLTVEDVNRLNARPDMLVHHGTSSSPEGRRRGDRAGVHLSQQQHPVIEGSLLLEPPDSSSDDSGANDSFTCSEFEYDNENARTRLDLDPSKMIFSKLTEVDNECDDPIIPGQNHQSQKGSNNDNLNGDGLNSNGDSFASTNASSSNSPSSPVLHPISSQYDFDALLNWGPNFDKLVGVFSDIAQLPDSGHPVGGATDHDYEEYV